MRTCTRCGKQKPIEEFARVARYKLTGQCHECWRRDQNDHYHRRKEDRWQERENKPSNIVVSRKRITTPIAGCRACLYTAECTKSLKAYGLIFCEDVWEDDLHRMGLHPPTPLDLSSMPDLAAFVTLESVTHV